MISYQPIFVIFYQPLRYASAMIFDLPRYNFIFDFKFKAITRLSLSFLSFWHAIQIYSISHMVRCYLVSTWVRILCMLFPSQIFSPSSE